MVTSSFILTVYSYQMLMTVIAVCFGYKVMRLTGCTRTFRFLLAFVSLLIVRHGLAMVTADSLFFPTVTHDDTWYIYANYGVVLPLISSLFTGFVVSLYYDLRMYLNSFYRKPPTP